MKKCYSIPGCATALLLLLSGYLQPAKAQAPTAPWAGNVWTHANDYGKSIVTDSANNVYTATDLVFTSGSGPVQNAYVGALTLAPNPRPASFSGTSKIEDAVLTKYSPGGQVIWAKRSKGMNRERIAGLAPTPGNELVLGGDISGDTAQFFGSTVYYFNPHPGAFRGMISKLDSSGNALWEKVLEPNLTNYSLGGLDPSGVKVKDVKCDVSGNIFALIYMDAYSTTIDGVTFTNMRRPGITNPFADVMVAKFSPSGSLLWGTLIGTDDDDYPGERLALDQQGNPYFTGSFFGDTLMVNHTPLFAMTSYGDYLVKLNGGNGAFAWAKPTKGVAGRDLVVDTVGNIYVAGYIVRGTGTQYFANDTLAVPQQYLYATKTALLKYDPSGGELWARTAGKQGPMGTNDWPSGVRVDRNGCIYLTGSFSDSNFYFSNSNVALFNTTPIASATWPYADIYLAKYNEAGTLLWARKAGDSSSESPQSMAIDRNDNLYLIGSYQIRTTLDGVLLSGGDPAAGDAFVVKFNATGGNCYPGSTGIEEAVSSESGFRIYPNPNNGQFVVECAALPEAGLTLIDAVGRVVHEAQLKQGHATLTLRQAVPGVYLLRIWQGGQMYQKRLVLTGE